MANEFSYFNTPYTFINPVRYFKANDPYYYEVDNIPIKQLEESSNFLKDQVDGLLNFKDNLNIEIGREGFTELKPYATGNDRKVRVKPGKYTARINNAYDLTPLQVVSQVGGYANDEPGLWEGNTWESETVEGDTVKATLDEFQKGLIGTAYMMNGLYERAFVYPVGDEDGVDLPAVAAAGFPYLNVTTPGYDYAQLGTTWMFAPYPNYTGIQPGYHITAGNKLSLNKILKRVAKNQGRVEANFIRRFRGAIRTSIVDVPEELEITIPDYSEDDFFIINADGDREAVSSDQRIDLLFIYTKAVDETTTTINKFDANGNPTQITRAELGIVKGAGVGLSRRLAAQDGEFKDLLSIRDEDGTPLMFANPADKNGTTVGFSTSAGLIKGSFPSPDDLMNLAPVLSENLETNALPLIGQSILPIAYVRVQNAGGPIVDLITVDDIIDIRPFFRTTELAYNERAGIAAATPQVSIANPVVTETHLEGMRQEMITPLDNRLTDVEAITGGLGASVANLENITARTVAYGNILGGFKFGPEGALGLQFKHNVGGGINTATINNTLHSALENELGLKAGAIGNLPMWDKSEWYKTGDFTGTQANDWINVANGGFVNPGIGGPAAGLGTHKGGTTQNEIGLMRAAQGANFRVQGWRGEAHANKHAMVFWVSKRVNIDRSRVAWMDDYDVNVNYLNCVPITGRTKAGAGEGIWVDKFRDYFIINVAWTGPDWRRAENEDSTNLAQQQGSANSRSWIGTNKILWGGTDNGTETYNAGNPGGHELKPWANRNTTAWFCGFGLPQIDVKTDGVLQKYVPFKQGPAHYNDGLNRGYGTGTSTSNGQGGSRRFTKPEYLSPLTPILYPSISFSVTGYGSTFRHYAYGNNGRRLAPQDPTLVLV